MMHFFIDSLFLLGPNCSRKISKKIFTTFGKVLFVFQNRRKMGTAMQFIRTCSASAHQTDLSWEASRVAELPGEQTERFIVAKYQLHMAVILTYK